jgi:hypothetical protein
VLLALLASQVVAMAQGSASTVASSPACSVASWWSSSVVGSLALLNDRSQIISVCPVFAKAFPKERLRFNDIQRRAAVNNLTDALKNDGVSESDIRKHLQVLSQVPLEGATVKDKKLILKNLMLTGERLKDLVIVEKGARGLLGQQDLNAEEKEFARKSLLWVYELKLDFKNAYSVASQMQFPDLKPEQRHLKLALLAELTGKNPIEHYEAFLSSTKTTRAANEVRAKLIRMSKNKWAALERNLSFLKSTPEILASLTVEIYLQSPNIQKLDKISKIPKLSQTLEGQRLAKIYSLYSQQKALAEISRLRFTKNNDKAIQKSIKLRIAAFKKTRAIYESALRSNHLSLQALSLRVLAQENLRFGNEIQMLPAPRGLNKNELKVYRSMLQEQAKQYLAANEEAKALLNNLLANNSGAIDELANAVVNGSNSDRLYAKYEYRNLKTFMTPSQSSKIEDAISDTKVTAKELDSAKKLVRVNPMNPDPIKRLKALETRRGNGPLIAFLDQRLAQLETEGRR